MNNLLIHDNRGNSHLFLHCCDGMLTMFSHDNAVRTDGNVIVLTEILDRSVVVLAARARDNVTTEGKKRFTFNRACLHIVHG